MLVGSGDLLAEAVDELERIEDEVRLPGARVRWRAHDDPLGSLLDRVQAQGRAGAVAGQMFEAGLVVRQDGGTDVDGEPRMDPAQQP